MRSRNGLKMCQSAETNSWSLKIDEGGRAPGESAASVEGPLVDRYCIRRAGPVEAKSCVEDIALAVERNCGIAARFVRATDQVLNARDQCSDLARVGRGRVC